MIKILPPQEARRIAAGEVIDRPAALVREFLDNAIDAGSNNIEVSIEEGGCKKVEITDDGSGMSREDLELCVLTHATSKIRGLDDLDSVVTLGFRGEALAAAAAVSRLEIICSTDGREAWKLECGPTENVGVNIEQFRRTKGTTVRSLNLFESIPARKRFLKREGSEGTLCRQIFLDKALAFNSINFKFIQDGKLKDFLPAVSSKKERFAALLQKAQANFLHEITVTGNNFSAVIVIGGPELYRNDRRQMYIFANGRRINDYSLIQAMEYGSQGWFPNGTHPVGAVFIEIDPSLADFNIHPAKREVRFKDAGAIHQAVSGGLRNFFHSYYLKTSHKDTKAQSTQREELEFNLHRGVEPLVREGTEAQREEKFEFNSHKNTKTQSTQREELEFSISEIKDKFYNKKITNNNLLPDTRHLTPIYIGRVFNLFILIQYGEKLYIIDQHAAHERILYDKFLKEPVAKQELLAPIPFTTESDEEDEFLITKSDELSRLGIVIKKDDVARKGSWFIEALPAGWKTGDEATVKEILDLRNAGSNIAEKWAASYCCRAAIKDGDYPDDETAFALGMEALNLPNPRCPHGRPVWTEISREALFKAVRRE